MCIAAHEQLKSEGVKSRVVSMPSWELFEHQGAEYREQVLPSSVKARVCVEQAGTFGWERYAGDGGSIIAMKTFGASDPSRCDSRSDLPLARLFARVVEKLDLSKLTTGVKSVEHGGGKMIDEVNEMTVVVPKHILADGNHARQADIDAAAARSVDVRVPPCKKSKARANDNAAVTAWHERMTKPSAAIAYARLSLNSPTRVSQVQLRPRSSARPRSSTGRPSP